jgi:hypothetical protein
MTELSKDQPASLMVSGRASTTKNVTRDKKKTKSPGLAQDTALRRVIRIDLLMLRLIVYDVALGEQVAGRTLESGFDPDTRGK